MIEGHIHRIRLEEARGRLTILGRCECGIFSTDRTLSIGHQTTWDAASSRRAIGSILFA